MASRPSPFAALRQPDAITVDPRDAAAEALRRVRRSKQSVEERAAEVEANRELTLWTWKDRVPEPKAGTLNLRDFPFQAELYGPEMTEDPEAGFEKCTQAGISAWALRLGLFHADIRGLTVLYGFPQDRYLRDFSNMRIKPVLRKSEWLRSRISSDAVDNVTLKQVGLGFIAFRAPGQRSADPEDTTTGALESVDADLVIIDEYDLFPPDAVLDVEQRITSPTSAGMFRWIGNPSVPSYGVDAKYRASQQRCWTVKCDECDEWNRLEGFEGWKANVDLERAIVVCRRCREPLDVRRGEWVAKFPDRGVRGYHLPKYAIHGLDLGPVIVRSKRKKPYERRRFHNKDLGEPFVEEEGRLSEEQLRACVRPELHLLEGASTANLVTMGCDFKSRWRVHVRISEHLDEYRKRPLWIGVLDKDDETTPFDKLVRFMDLYGVNMAVLDHMPEWQQATAFCDRFPGRAFKYGFLTGKDARQAAQTGKPLQVDDEDRLALIRRTQALDTTLDLFRRQWNLLPELDELPEDYAKHLGAPVRVVTRDERGRSEVYYRSMGEDDFAFAEVADMVATELFYRQSGIEAVQLEASQPHATRDSIEFAASRLADLEADDYREGFAGDEFGDRLE